MPSLLTSSEVPGGGVTLAAAAKATGKPREARRWRSLTSRGVGAAPWPRRQRPPSSLQLRWLATKRDGLQAAGCAQGLRWSAAIHRPSETGASSGRSFNAGSAVYPRCSAGRALKGFELSSPHQEDGLQRTGLARLVREPDATSDTNSVLHASTLGSPLSVGRTSRDPPGDA